MKSTLFALGLAATAFLAPAISHAADNGNGGFFINGNVGQSNLNKGPYNDDDTAYGANVGYRWALSPSLALGVEGGYTNLGSFDAKDSLSDLGLRQAKVDGWNLGVNGHYNLSPNWYVSARGGFFRADVKGGFLDGTTPVSINDNSNKYYAGAGFGYDFSNNFSVGLNYDYYKTDTKSLNLDPTLVSVSAEYRFQ